MPDSADADRLRIGDALHARLQADQPEAFPSLSESVYERLWKRIVNGEFAPGARLSEEVLSRELGVSRTPVREALLRLGEAGLVRVAPRRGFAVPVVTGDDLRELYELREAVETWATRRAAPALTDAEIAEARQRHADAHAAAADGSSPAAERFMVADIALHDTIQRRGGNRRTVRLLGDLMGQLSLPSLRAALDDRGRALAIAEHDRILDALVRRDAEAAAAAMQAHIRAVAERAQGDFAPVEAAS